MTIVRSGSDVIKVKYLRKKIPLLVGWALTNRCFSKCIYCNSDNVISKELDTKKILHIIDGLKRMGTKAIAYTGGEPLIREDIAQIIKYTKNKGIHAMLITNGLLLGEKSRIIKWIDLITVSLDGPREINDFQRGKGTHDKVLEIIKYLRNQNKKVEITVTLTKYNLKELDYLFGLSKKLEIFLTFQIVSQEPLGVPNIDFLLPSKQDLNEAYRRILIEKSRNKLINHSIAGIKYYLDWPKLRKLNCWAGRLFCRIRSDGLVDACSMVEDKDALDCSVVGFETAFINTKKVFCEGCWCSNVVELNYIVNANLNSMLNAIKFLY